MSKNKWKSFHQNVLVLLLIFLAINLPDFEVNTADNLKLQSNAVSSQGTPLWEDNFNSETVGSFPSSWTAVSINPGIYCALQVVATGHTLNPFGSGAPFVIISDAQSGSHAEAYQDLGVSVSSGIFSFLTWSYQGVAPYGVHDVILESSDGTDVITFTSYSKSLTHWEMGLQGTRTGINLLCLGDLQHVELHFSDGYVSLVVNGSEVLVDIPYTENDISRLRLKTRVSDYGLETWYDDFRLYDLGSGINAGHYKGVETFRSYSVGEDPGFYSGESYTSSNWESSIVGEHYGHRMVLFIDTSSPTNYWESFNFASAGTGVIEMYAMIADANAPIVFKISNMWDNSASMTELFWYTNIGNWEQRSSWDNTPDIVATQNYVSDYEWFIPKFTYSTVNGGTWTFSITYGPDLEYTRILSSVTNVDALLGDVVQISVSNAWSSGVDTWIDSVSYTWSVDPPYNEGDLLEIETGYNPPNSNDMLIIIGLIALAIVISSFFIIKLNSTKIRGKISDFKEKRLQNSVLRIEKGIPKREVIDKSKERNIENLRNILQMSNRMRIQDAADVLELERSELLKILINNRKTLEDVKIDGDYIVVSSGEDMNSFISVLDAQFQLWNSKGKK